MVTTVFRANGQDPEQDVEEVLGFWLTRFGPAMSSRTAVSASDSHWPT